MSWTMYQHLPGHHVSVMKLSWIFWNDFTKFLWRAWNNLSIRTGTIWSKLSSLSSKKTKNPVLKLLLQGLNGCSHRIINMIYHLLRQSCIVHELFFSLMKMLFEDQVNGLKVVCLEQTNPFWSIKLYFLPKFCMKNMMNIRISNWNCMPIFFKQKIDICFNVWRGKLLKKNIHMKVI